MHTKMIHILIILLLTISNNVTKVSGSLSLFLFLSLYNIYTYIVFLIILFLFIVFLQLFAQFVYFVFSFYSTYNIFQNKFLQFYTKFMHGINCHVLHNLVHASRILVYEHEN